MLELALLLVALGFLTMVGTLGYQAYLYLKYGEWAAISVTHACSAYLHLDWCGWPENWVGAHKMLSQINAGVFVFVICMMAFWIASISDSKN